MFTKILSPMLASHAPIVNIINAKIKILLMFDKYRKEGISNTKVNIIPSKHSRAISKWVRWIMKAKRVIR